MSLSPGMESWGEFLARSQNADGGWGYLPPQPSMVEPTSYAIIALADTDPERRVRGARWLARAQNPDGGWGYQPLDGESSWHTAPALLARVTAAQHADRRAVGFLLEHRSRPIRRRRDPAVNKIDTRLKGWPWTPDTFGWVEPTSHALIALKRCGVHDPAMEEAERLLLDRQCEQGGWNYGNVRVLGVALPPYPYTTAVALLALRSRREKNVDRALAYLERFSEGDASSFDLAWAVLALTAYGRRTEHHRVRLTALQDAEGSWSGNTLYTALAALALAAGATNPFAT